MLESRERVKSSFEPCNKLYTEMKKSNVPLSQAERNRVLNIWWEHIILTAIIIENEADYLIGGQ